MATLKEMAEAHLLNVQREIQQLNERKAAIDQDIARLASYLDEGKKTLEEDIQVESPIPQSQTFLGDNYGK
ncbi:MAG: hypothetical protein FI729_00890 [SAR202 cluster bacterium]|nr:hypothetical protein [SAR202 cluster bacterium]|tara:strand:- start:598 stop:810 length:213 start_codon:yes stop_codon:yes gene_type:complete